MSAYREAVWEAVPHDAVPEAFAQRRAWLLGRVPPHANVVDLGCGDGAFAAELLASGATVIGLDVAEGALERARQRAPGAQLLLAGEDGALPVADGWADVVWAGEVLEHAVDPVGLVLESRRMLGPEGRLLVTTPAHGPLLTRTARLDPRADHLRFFSARSLRAVLGEAFPDVSVRRGRGHLYACAS
jgi:2-polyprenyl-3-methyl-5-hydroxy-6-metoxy-1,4-benzoquinol methylase